VHDRIVLNSHAKINFYLDVLDQRADGFNNIETIFQTISLCDRLTLTRDGGALELHCDHADLAAEPDNLVLRAGRALLAHAGCTAGARMWLEKRIPVAAGLAGGSGDAAAALAGLNELWELGLSPAALNELALGLGSDVPYCLRGGTARATGRGEEIVALPEIPETWLVLVHPPVGVSAGWVYKHPQLERSGEVPVNGQTPRFARALAALAAGDIPSAVFNRMERVVFEAHPALAAWKGRLLEAGCIAAAMSGSGPTLYGVCDSEAQARSVAAAFDDVITTVAHSVGTGLRRED
jgi:4-diphosphocytidyl-2-C-methyl-D-erythritol kinase